MTESVPLEQRFTAHLATLGVGAHPSPLVVAVSGGCDSVVLLHLLRFCAPHFFASLTVAHLDHAMRGESAEDARWVAELCEAWGVPLVSARLSRAPRGETDARVARWAFLRGVAADASAERIATAHHADDQAETILFRAVRGTGLQGLTGMPALSADGVLRPLLPFWRRELEEYARARGLGWREDASNLSSVPARNRIRLEILPLIEAEVASGARRNLVELGRLAGEAEGALELQAERAMQGVVSRKGDAFVLARAQMRDYDSAIGTRVVRHLLRHFGVVPSSAGTRGALQFITHAPSGRELTLAGGVRVRVEFDDAWIERARSAPHDPPLEIALPRPGERVERGFWVGGRAYELTAEIGSWEGDRQGGWRTALVPGDTAFPLSMREWRPGDRMRTVAGSKTLKKLFLERRVPRSERHQRPVLADATGRVLWVGGLERPTEPLPADRQTALLLTIVHD